MKKYLLILNIFLAFFALFFLISHYPNRVSAFTKDCPAKNQCNDCSGCDEEYCSQKNCCMDTSYPNSKCRAYCQAECPGGWVEACGHGEIEIDTKTFQCGSCDNSIECVRS